MNKKIANKQIERARAIRKAIEIFNPDDSIDAACAMIAGFEERIELLQKRLIDTELWANHKWNCSIAKGEKYCDCKLSEMKVKNTSALKNTLLITRNGKWETTLRKLLGLLPRKSEVDEI